MEKIESLPQYFRVKYRKRILKSFKTRKDATGFCEQKARMFVPPKVSPSEFKNASVVFHIEMIKDGKVISKEIYTVIVVMKK